MSPYRGVPGLPRVWVAWRVTLLHLIHASRLAVAVAKQLVLPPFLIHRAARAVHHVPPGDVRRRGVSSLGAAGHDRNFRGTFIGYLAKVIQAGLARLTRIKPRM